jgi:non-specific serine/threonine protein kinase
MASAASSERYRFGAFELQLDERRLLASGTPVAIKPRAFGVLVALVARHGRLVTKENLLAQVWPGVIVEENAVHTQVSALRKVLGADAIATVSGVGYRFTLEVAEGRVESEIDSPTPARHNLVRQLTTFIGREQQLAELKELLNRIRLLTLTGAGGCGKSRLALELGVQVSDAYADGVWLVELAALADAELVPQAVAHVLGLKERPSESLTDTLLGHLASKHLLLVLDNAEHLLAACAELVRTLVQRCARLTVLVTSREHLGVLGELTYRVPSLSVPDLDQKQDADALLAHESVRLFIDRARLQQPHLAVTAQSAVAAASICARLDGIPLAIELAAARVRALSVEEVDHRLDERFRLLTDNPRTALPRHRTLRALIDWSYDLLSDGEQALFHRLAVFAGGWTLASAEQVCAGDGIDAADIFERLTSLVDKSLVLTEERAGLTRYRMLETVRRYAAERLRKEGTEATWRGRHLAWSVALAEEFHRGVEGPEQDALYDRIAGELDNLRAAVAWAIESDPVQGIRLAYYVWSFMDLRGHEAEGRKWLNRLLEACPADASALDRARALRAAAQLAISQRDYLAADSQLQESLALYREVDDPHGTVRALLSQARLKVELARYPEAEVLAREAIDLARDTPTMLKHAYLYLAMALYGQGRWAAARELFHQSLEEDRRMGRRSSLVTYLHLMGLAECDEDRPDLARGHFAECMTIAMEIGARSSIIDSLEGIAGVAAATGAPIRAARLWGAADALRQEDGCPRSIRENMIVDRQVKRVHSTLTTDEFNEAWNQGRAMTLDDAVRYALDEDAGSSLPKAERQPPPAA